MAYEVTHKNGKKVTIHEIGDTVMIPNPQATDDSLLQPRMIPYTFKHSRKHQNRSKY